MHICLFLQCLFLGGELNFRRKFRTSEDVALHLLARNQLSFAVLD